MTPCSVAATRRWRAHRRGHRDARRRGWTYLRTASRAMIRWSMQEPGLASLLYTRPVPGFEPSAEAFAPSQAMWQRLAARPDGRRPATGSSTPSADSDDAMRMLTVLDLPASAPAARQPARSLVRGRRLHRLTDDALDMFVHRYTEDKARNIMRQHLTHDQVSRYIDATPEELYDVVADVTRTPELTDDIVSCTWIGGRPGRRSGARFHAVNNGRGKPHWTEQPRRRSRRPRSGVRVHAHRDLRRHRLLALPVRTRGNGHPGDRVVRSSSARSPRSAGS